MKDKFYYKISDDEKEIIKTVQKRTITEYDIQNDFINVKHIMYMVEDLLNEVSRLEEELEEEIQYRNDNFKMLSPSELGYK
jgi:hypothetical protein